MLDPREIGYAAKRKKLQFLTEQSEKSESPINLNCSVPSARKVVIERGLPWGVCVCFISSLSLYLSPSPSLSLCDFSCVNVRGYVRMCVRSCVVCVRRVDNGDADRGFMHSSKPSTCLFVFCCSTCVLACHAHAQSAYDLTSVRKSVCSGPHIQTPCMFAAGWCPLGVHLCAGNASVRILGCVCVCKCVWVCVCGREIVWWSERHCVCVMLHAYTSRIFFHCMQDAYMNQNIATFAKYSAKDLWKRRM